MRSPGDEEATAAAEPEFAEETTGAAEKQEQPADEPETPKTPAVNLVPAPAEPATAETADPEA